jgi:hypothetical protein
MSKRFIQFILLVLFLGCSEKNRAPYGILSKEEMQSVLWDMMQADAFTKTYIKRSALDNDSIANIRLQQQIFSIHHTNKDVFYKSYSYYSTHSEAMLKILDSIILRADKGRNKLERLQIFPSSN